MALTRKQLNGVGCAIANCGHDHSTLFLHATCHIKSGVYVAYSKAEGTLKITCAKCKAPVAEVSVAKE